MHVSSSVTKVTRVTAQAEAEQIVRDEYLLASSMTSYPYQAKLNDCSEESSMVDEGPDLYKGTRK